MTEKEAIDIIKDSALWEELSKTEKAEAISYAIGLAKQNITLQLKNLIHES